MRLLLSVLAATFATFASAKGGTIIYTLSSANGGSSTRFTWEIGGAWTTGGVTLYDPNPPGSVVIGINDVGLSVIDVTSISGMRNFISANGVIPADFADSFAATFSGLDLGLTMTNLTTGASRAMSTISIEGMTSGGVQGMFFNIRIPGGNGGMLPVTNGQTVLVSGTTSGFIDLAQDFSVFNEGYWTSTNGSFSQTLIIGSVPEPSTTLLGLFGTALLFRRRRVA